jgi:transposase-like protein
MTDARRPFRGFRFPAEVVLWAVRWYLRFPVSYRDLEAMLADRGVRVDHVTLYRWVQRFAPELEKRLRRHLRPCRGPWHVDETFVRVGGEWRYLYRAVDGTGQTVDFLLSAKRDKRAAKRFLRGALARENTRNPREIVTDRLKSYPGALREMKRDGELWRFVRHRRGRWLNNLIEQDHRRVKRRTRPMLGFESFRTARRTLAGVEAMAMLPRDRCAPCPGTTCRPSGPSSTKCSASRPDRKEAGRELAAVSKRNEPADDVGATIAGRRSRSTDPGRPAVTAGTSKQLIVSTRPPSVADDNER